jgi:hypothetical protein
MDGDADEKDEDPGVDGWQGGGQCRWVGGV